ncbi:MAG: peptidylprolyl isomerase [Defluviicoccus sp.]|nr:peptidylprolyl isomerase [Defluviicoccus sp.]
MRLISVLFLAATIGLAPQAHAQSVQRIAVVVNDEVVSVRDLRDRIRLVLFLSGIADTRESRRRIANQVVRTLVDERLQLQEAKKRGLTVSDDEVALALAEMERANRMAPGGLSSVLAESRVSQESLRAQFRARIAWSKLVRRRLAPRIDIGDEEVTAFLARLEASQGEEAYRLGEILLPVSRGDDEATVRNAALRMVAQIREGARFGALARQFSRTATAAVGGDLGWAARSDLDPAVAAAVAKLAPGDVLDPIRTVSGFRILTLTERRDAAADPKEAALDLRQILVPLADEAKPARIAARLKQAASAARVIEGCEDLGAVAEALGAGAPRNLGTLRPSELSAAIRENIAEVGDGRAGVPIRVPGGIALFAVCGRVQPRSTLPDRETVARRLRDQRLNLAAQRYLRDLRSAAVVDIRI